MSYLILNGEEIYLSGRWQQEELYYKDDEVFVFDASIRGWREERREWVHWVKIECFDSYTVSKLLQGYRDGAYGTPPEFLVERDSDKEVNRIMLTFPISNRRKVRFEKVRKV